MDTADDINYMIEQAIINGKPGVVRSLIEISKNIPGYKISDTNRAISLAFRHSHTDLIPILLKDGRFNPAVDNNDTIIRAAQFGDLETVKLLLADPRVDPTVSDALGQAVFSGHYKIVMLLLDAGADPSAENNNAIHWAARLGHTEIVRVLLKDKRVDPTTRDVVEWAARLGHYDTVKVLLEDPRIDPTADESAALYWAFNNRHWDIYELLEQHGCSLRERRKRKELSSAVDNTIEIAIDYNQTGLIKAILSDNYTASIIDYDRALKLANKSGRTKIAELLSQCAPKK